MNDREYIIILYDYYSELLSDKQRLYFEEYYFNNLSLTEISENYDISRNAAHKCIQGVVSKLYEFEDKIHLYNKSIKIEKLVADIDDKLKKQIIDILKK